MAIFNPLINILFPPTCMSCGEEILEAHQLCLNCWHELDFIADPICDITGNPLPINLSDGEQYLSMEAILRPPQYDKARACVQFNDISKRIVHQLKYKDQMSVARLIAALMIPMLKKLINDLENPILCAVPLHYSRFLKRKYNQSELICDRLAKALNIDQNHGLVKRSKATRRQVGLKVDARRSNVKSAFMVDPKQAKLMVNRAILLVDDVITSSATLNEVAKQLKALDVGPIYAISFAKTVQQNVI